MGRSPHKCEPFYSPYTWDTCLVGSFAEAVKWWITTRMRMPAEELADYYLKLIGYDEYLAG